MLLPKLLHSLVEHCARKNEPVQIPELVWMRQKLLHMLFARNEDGNEYDTLGRREDERDEEFEILPTSTTPQEPLRTDQLPQVC